MVGLLVIVLFSLVQLLLHFSIVLQALALSPSLQSSGFYYLHHSTASVLFLVP